MSARQGSDPGPGLIGQAAGDEALDDTAYIHDAERRVLGADEGTDLVDDDLEHLFHRQHARDGTGRGIDRTEEVRAVARGLDIARRVAHRPERSIRPIRHGPDGLRGWAEWPL